MTDTCGPAGETDKTASDIQTMARTLDEIGKKCPGKSGHMKSLNSIMSENHEDFLFDLEDVEFKETISRILT